MPLWASPMDSPSQPSSASLAHRARPTVWPRSAAAIMARGSLSPASRSRREPRSSSRSTPPLSMGGRRNGSAVDGPGLGVGTPQTLGDVKRRAVDPAGLGLQRPQAVSPEMQRVLAGHAHGAVELVQVEQDLLHVLLDVAGGEV